MTQFDSRMEDLAERTRQASERVRAAAGATKEKLQSQVSTARTSIEKTNQQFEEKVAGAARRGVQALGRGQATVERPHRRDQAEG